MGTRDRFPTLDTDHTTTTVEQDAAAARWCQAQGDDGLVHVMLGLDGAPFNPQKHAPRYRGNRVRDLVQADPALLPAGWARDSTARARVIALVTDLTSQGLTVNETARRTGLSSRSVQRLRNGGTTSSHPKYRRPTGDQHAEEG